MADSAVLDLVRHDVRLAVFSPQESVGFHVAWEGFGQRVEDQFLAGPERDVRQVAQ